MKKYYVYELYDELGSLLYVGMTRAMNELILTHNRSGYSEFLDDVDPFLVDYEDGNRTIFKKQNREPVMNKTGIKFKTGPGGVKIPVP